MTTKKKIKSLLERFQGQCANMLLENAALKCKINWLSLTFNLMMSCTYVMFWFNVC